MSLVNGYVTQQVACVHTLWQTLFSNFCCWISKDDYALALMAWTLWTFIVFATHLNFVQHLASNILLTPCIKEVCQSFMQVKQIGKKLSNHVKGDPCKFGNLFIMTCKMIKLKSLGKSLFFYDNEWM
jgi:hypothetical protein